MSAPMGRDVTLTIRRGTEADIPAILPLMTRFNQEELIAFSVDKGRRGLLQLIHHSGWGMVLVAESDHELVGYALLAYGFDLEYGGRDAFLCELFVAEPLRGGGLGKALLGAAEQAARGAGAGALHLLVRQENARARAIYDKAGFKLDPRPLMTKSLSDE